MEHPNKILQDQNAEILAIQIWINAETLTIAVDYKTPNSPFNPNRWEIYISESNDTENFLLIEDFNHIY